MAFALKIKKMQNNSTKIMIIDDDQYTLNLYQEILQNLYYENNVYFESGIEALKELDDSFELIIMDYYLNDINGDELFKKIKEKCPNTQIVVASAQQDMMVAINFLKKGAFDYILKSNDDLENLSEILYKFEIYKSSIISNNEAEIITNNRITNLVLQAEYNIRNEIANELHDNIAQILYSTKLFLDTAISSLPQKLNHLETAKLQINQVIDEIKTLSRRLKFTKENSINLDIELEKLINTLKGNPAIYVNNSIKISEANNSLSNTTKINTIRILQEISNNSLKYSKATQIDISVKEFNNFLEIRFKDNGIGFEIDKVNKGLGLNNIINRIKMENGTYELNSKLNFGCEWQFSLPIIMEV